MHKSTLLILAVLMTASLARAASDDSRIRVELPQMMEAHMLANMRDHLEMIDALIGHLAADEFDVAAELAETRLGMSSLGLHKAGHMAPFMPDGMRDAGSAMHRAASRFARVAVEGDTGSALVALREVTAACTACHRGYRVR